MKRISWIIGLLFLLSFSSLAQQDSVRAVGQRTLLLEDKSRDRPLDTEVWYPTREVYQETEEGEYTPFIYAQTVRNGAVAAGKYPLVLLSHGFGGNRLTLEWLASGLARKGFVVAAVDHWGNTFDNLLAEESIKFLDRPRDISFVLTELLKDTTFGQVIDESCIGVAGFSLGGFTAIALAGGEFDYQQFMAEVNKGNQKALEVPELPTLYDLMSSDQAKAYFKATSPQVKDERIRAVFAMAPGLGQGFAGKKQLQKVEVPVFLVGAEADDVTPNAANALHYHRLIPEAQFELLRGKVGHYVFLNEAKEPIREHLPMFYKDDASVNRKAVHEKVTNLAAEFFSHKL
ncbi:MAG: dienelactone hydrolase [Hymenobacteraceae bacterium]|nr:dienelactone hydrolase [Hymenobacteraceae bacterium]